MTYDLFDVIKTLFYQKEPYLISFLSIDDKVFSEPLLFAYFNSKQYSFYPKEILEEIMQGYFTEKEPLKMEHSYNKNGIAYIPEMGYYNHNKELIEPTLEIEGLEVVKELHPLLHRYLFEFYKGHITNPNPDYESVWQNHIATLEKALKLLKEHTPDYFREFQSANRKIFIHNNPKILNFTSIETLGMLYFYATPQATMMY